MIIKNSKKESIEHTLILCVECAPKSHAQSASNLYTSLVWFAFYNKFGNYRWIIGISTVVGIGTQILIRDYNTYRVAGNVIHLQYIALGSIKLKFQPSDNAF